MTKQARNVVAWAASLQVTAGIANDGDALLKIAKLTPSFLAGTRGAQGTIWLEEHQTLRRRVDDRELR